MNNLRFVKYFQVLIVSIVAVILVGLFTAFYTRTESLTENIILQQARAFVAEILLTRKWVNEHGGVYVPVKPGTEPNPYLAKIPGLKATIRDEQGKLYTLRNPSTVTREISELADRSALFKFRISSLRYINPSAKPDAFERKALQSFERGKKESQTVLHTQEGAFFRYMVPVYYEKSCDKCHLSMSYKPGDVRGGISVTIPMTLVNQQMKANRDYLAMSAILVLALLFISMLIISAKFTKLVSKAHADLAKMATTDALTGLLNRKSGIEELDEEIARHSRSQTPLSCLMLDIDNFKSINDKYGHQAGDAALASFARLVSHCLRSYDIMCRYGGEEFMILLPETNAQDAQKAAERIRETVAATPIIFEDATILITVSIGVAGVDKIKSEKADHFIRLADAALYRAKREGRNRVVVHKSSQSDGPACA